MHILLPPQPRRVDLRAFWLVLCLGAGVAAGLALAWLLAPVWMWAALAVAAAAGAWGWAVPRRSAPAYAAWNRIAAAFARRARGWVLRAYWPVVAAASNRARGLRLEPPREGMWAPRGTQAAHAYASPSEAAARRRHVPEGGRAGRRTGGWMADYVRWSARGGRLVGLALLPSLALLRALGARPPAKTPPGIYTLY